MVFDDIDDGAIDEITLGRNSTACDDYDLLPPVEYEKKFTERLVSV